MNSGAETVSMYLSGFACGATMPADSNAPNAAAIMQSGSCLLSAAFHPAQESVRATWAPSVQAVALEASPELPDADRRVAIGVTRSNPVCQAGSQEMAGGVFGRTSILRPHEK